LSKIAKNCDHNIDPWSLWLHPGVDVTITIIGDFCQFPAKKMAFFSKTNVMITFSAKLPFILGKNAYFFAKFFCENIFKNHNIGPGWKKKKFQEKEEEEEEGSNANAVLSID
jgi:hypothetical protein